MEDMERVTLHDLIKLRNVPIYQLKRLNESLNGKTEKKGNIYNITDI